MKLRVKELHPPMLEDHTKLSQPVKRLSYFLKQSIKGLYTRQQVAATCRSETLRRRITYVLEKFVKIFVAATEFCRHNKSHRFSLIWFFCDLSQRQNLMQRQRFSQKFSSTHEVICCCEVSPHLVAATRRPTCSHGVICRRDVLQQLVA